MVHAGRRHGREGLAFFAALFFLGFVRENLVALYDLLYGFAPLTFSAGKAPLMAAVIWGFSIYAAVTWTEAVGWGSPFGPRDRGRDRDPAASSTGPGLYLGSALFMVSLACFYEPFLDLVGMARWEEETHTTLGVPWIALVGYPTLTVLFLGLWIGIRQWVSEPGSSRPAPARRWLLTLAALPVLALIHGWGLQALKDGLGW